MDTLRKNKLLNYLYSNNVIAEFMYNDFFVELSKVLPKKLCFSSENIKKENRTKNYDKALTIIETFLKQNMVYYNKLKELYSYKTDTLLFKDVLVGYTLFLTPHINKNTGADVYADTRSVCYSKISILDVDIL